jgi:DNA gyrase subunit A
MVSAVINISKEHKAANLMMCTVRGVVKKTPFEQYQNVRSNGLITINLDDGDELKWIRMTNGDNEVVISTAQGQAIRFHEKDVRPMGRVSRGVRGIRLRPSDRVIGMDVVEEGSSIFVISKFGYGKRTKVAQFTPHARGGVGIRSAVVNTKTGNLIGVKSLSKDETQEVIIVSSQGQAIRLGLKDIPELGRATQGVRIMRLNGTDDVVSLALVDAAPEEEDDEEGAEPAVAAKPVTEA